MTAIINSLPYAIADGQVIDAVPVMANFNAIVANVNNNSIGASGPGYITPSRSAGVVYTNTSSGARIVSIIISCGTSSLGEAQLIVGGVSLQYFHAPNGSTYGSIFGIIPPGVSYEVTLYGTAAINTWAEW